MPYVNVPNDLSKIKTKIAFNLTKRQLVCFGGAAAVGIPAYLLCRSAIGSTGAMFVMLAVMLPAFLLAMYEKHGQPLEVILNQMIQTMFVRPKVRPYQTNNLYSALERQIKVEKEVRAVVQTPQATPKAGSKTKA